MRNLIAAAAFTLAAVSAFAQPARDLPDAIAAARQHARDIEPALAVMRNESDALSKVVDVQRLLSGTPQSSIDRAFRLIDDYTDGMTRRNLALPRDQQKIMMVALRMLDDARRITPPDYPKFRDAFHHLIVHPMQQAVSRDMQQLMSLANQYQQMTTMIRGLETQTISAINGSASDPTRQ